MAAAAVLMGWNAMKEAAAPTASDLETVEGTLIDYRVGRRLAQHGVKAVKQFRPRARPANILRIQKADGATVEFSSRDRLAAPKGGWRKGEAIRVKHDSRGKLYEVMVGDETLRDVATTMERRDAERASMDRIATVLLFLGVPLTAVGYLASRHRPRRTQLPRA